MHILLLVALYIASVSWGFFQGSEWQKDLWEEKNMGDICAEGRLWACELNPTCTMNSVYCFPKLELSK